MRPLPLLALLALPTAACFGDSGNRPPGYDPVTCEGPLERPPIDSTAPITRWVIDSVDLPDSSTQANQLGLNLDGDPEGRPDNALGQVLAAVFSAIDSDLDGKVAGLIDGGELLHLLELQSSSLESASGVGARLFVGADRDGDPTDNFSGTESFDIAPGHPTRPMVGTIMDSRLRVDRGILPLGIALPGLDEPYYFELTAARIEAEVTDDRLTGRIAGVLTETQIDDELIPFIHGSLQNSVAIDCQPDCVPGSQGELYLDLFDSDDDGQITLEEVRDNALVESLLAPDVDLFDENREHRPRCDGVKDSISVGVGFTAVRADFVSP